MILWLVAPGARAQEHGGHGAGQESDEGPASGGETPGETPDAAEAAGREQNAHASDGSRPATDAATAARLDQLEERLATLERENEDLKEEVEFLREDQEFAEERTQKALGAANRFSGYLDVGFFWVGGNGSGIRPDIGHVHFPEYKAPEGETGISDSWVFMGDPLSTAINARGEPADTADSLAVGFDPLDSQGASSFAVNTFNLALFAGITDELTIDASVDFIPRKRDVSDPDGTFFGDFLRIRRAYARYVAPLDDVDLRIYGGKFDSVLGNEYRTQEAPDRLTVTPSLICRYTCGYPVGVKARLRLFDDALVLNTAITNGSHFMEYFPFYGETDTNHFKTAAGRLSYELPVGTGLEVGVSGAYGAQDLQTSEGARQWHIGADVLFDWRWIIFNAEYAQGNAPGRTEEGQPPYLPRCNLAQCVEYKGAYAQLGVRAQAWLIPYARVDWRDALHENGARFVYLSQLVRGTFGMRLELGPHALLKAEYILNRELGRIPQFSNDVFASSFVLAF